VTANTGNGFLLKEVAATGALPAPIAIIEHIDQSTKSTPLIQNLDLQGG
jgi:hypothetical protein